jgi:hypothetical protein
MSKYPHTIVFGFPTHWLTIIPYIEKENLDKAPQIIKIPSASKNKVFKKLMQINRTNPRNKNFQYVILRKTTSEIISPILKKSDQIFELDYETLHYKLFNMNLINQTIKLKTKIRNY